VRASASALQRESGVCRHTRLAWEAHTGETFVESVVDRHRAAVAAAVDVLQAQGEAVTLERVARRAGVSRRTLASQPALRAILDKAHPDPSSTK